MPMNKRIMLIALLAGISIFTLYKYVVTLREKYNLSQQLNKREEQLVLLEKEKQNLLQTIEKNKIWQKKLEEESMGLKVTLKGNEERLLGLKNDLFKAGKTVEQLSAQISTLRAENAELKAQIDKLKMEILSLSQENQVFRYRFNSVTELREAIRQLKKQGRAGFIGKGPDGNQGFMLKDGKFTFPAKVIIEVNPAVNK